MLHVHHYGPPSGPAVLAVHGVTAHGERFAGTAAAALPGHHVLAVDLRGHGRSSNEAPWTIEQHVTDLLEVMLAYGLDRVPVMGHSYGGTIATHLLATAPHRVERLLLLDPAIQLPGWEAAANAVALMNDAAYPTLEALVEARRVGRSVEAVPFSDEDARAAGDQSDYDDMWRMRYFVPAAIAGWSEMARRMPILPVAVPTLLVVAAQAGLVTDRQISHYRTQLDDALEVVTVDCGHMLYWDRFEETAALVRRFLG